MGACQASEWAYPEYQDGVAPEDDNFYGGGNNMNQISFEIPLEPTGQMRARRGRIIKTKTGKLFAPMHKSTKQAKMEAKLMHYIAPHAPPTLWTGPVGISITAYMEQPSTWPKWKKEIAKLITPTKNPDLDNILKNIKDVMEGIIYRNDNQVCVQSSCKEFSKMPKWKVLVWLMEDRYRHDVKKEEVVALRNG